MPHRWRYLQAWQILHSTLKTNTLPTDLPSLFLLLYNFLANVDEADEWVETEGARECFWTGLLYSTLTKIWLALYLQCYLCKTKCSRKKPAQSAGCPCRNADKKCSLHCSCGQKLQCKNGKNEGTEWENAQRLPGSTFDCHWTEIKQSV